MAKLLVTGGAGFIGSNFILYWLKKYPQDVIVNLDKLTYAGNLENLTSVASLGNYHFVKGDICDGKLVNQITTDVDIIVHFAAETHVDRSITGAAPFIQTNIVGTHVLLEAVLTHKIKHFHHISTDEVFGSLTLESKQKFIENTPYNPRSPYSATKAASDHLVRAYFTTYGLPVTITNCSNNFGPYQYPEKLIPLAITNLLEDKNVPIYGDGLHVRDWLYVEDHCRAIDLVINKGRKGEIYCVGGTTRDISNLTIIKKILKIMGKDENSLKFVKDRPGHDRKYALDWSKIKRELGWKPMSDLDTYLVKTCQWYKQNQTWWKKLKTIEYQKYYQKQYSDL
jgi:dTDP-glucose 4,6-dehydratase